MSAEQQENQRDFISRELSWLDFNSRVLDEAGFVANKLLERLKFIAIFSSNLDEFFMVRIAGLRQLVQTGANRPDPAGNRPERQLALARAKIRRMLRRQYKLLLEDILPQLEAHGVFLRCIRELPPQCSKQLKRYFINEIMPVLTPLAVDSAHPFPLLNSGALEIALALKRSTSEEIVHAFVEVPEVLPRFVSLPEVAESEADSNDGKVELLLLEELISEHIMELFPGCELVDKLFFRITRDMDFSVEEEMMDDLLKTIRGKLLQRRQRAPIRLEVSGDKLHSELGEFLVDSLGISGEFCYSLPGPLHLKQFFALVSAANRPELLEEPWQPVMPAVFREFPSVMDAIREKENILLPVPYCSFTPVVQLLEQAAVDPDVLAIKQTLYRVSGNSPIITAGTQSPLR